MTLKELAEKVNMSPAELLEWFPGMFDPQTADNEMIDAELAEDVLNTLRPNRPWDED